MQLVYPTVWNANLDYELVVAIEASNLHTSRFECNMGNLAT